MTVHIFIGAGPANLHRALKIQKHDKRAKLIIVDKRFTEKGEINPFSARANIFRFETEITESLIEDGVNRAEFERLIYNREFDCVKGFQYLDNLVFSNKQFSQIQIRDLQKILLDTLKKSHNPPMLHSIPEGINIDDPVRFKNQISDLLQEEKVKSDESVQIHVATGAQSQGNPKKNMIIYSDGKGVSSQEPVSTELMNMVIVPVHGTTTFNLEDKISCEELEEAQLSLDQVDWDKQLVSQYGWKLIRPPRIRVFYANQILYVGAEIPVSIYSANPFERKSKLEAYTRTITKMIFPTLADRLDHLVANTDLQNTFLTLRGEYGQAVFISWDRRKYTIFHHGDRRYLPHYQTGSGFVTAFLQNQIYSEIYRRNSLKQLTKWAKSETIKKLRGNFSYILGKYQKAFSGKKLVREILTAFQAELYITLTRDVIEANKEKVAHYFSALACQELEAFASEQGLNQLIYNYNLCFNNFSLRKSHFGDTDPRIIVMELLRSTNRHFIGKIFGLLFNINSGRIKPEMMQLLLERQLNIYEKLLPLEPSQKSAMQTLARDLLRIADFVASYLSNEALHIAIGRLIIELNKLSMAHKGVSFLFFSSDVNKFMEKFMHDLLDIQKSNNLSLFESKSLLMDKMSDFYIKAQNQSMMPILQGLIVNLKNQEDALQPQSLRYY